MTLIDLYNNLKKKYLLGINIQNFKINIFAFNFDF